MAWTYRTPTMPPCAGGASRSSTPEMRRSPGATVSPRFTCAAPSSTSRRVTMPPFSATTFAGVFSSTSSGFISRSRTLTSARQPRTFTANQPSSGMRSSSSCSIEISRSLRQRSNVWRKMLSLSMLMRHSCFFWWGVMKSRAVSSSSGLTTSAI
ncbi:hypothetical protein SDC9_163890 [bioreactor metagenome]|uniref:Uncharacterized protein n=1 Tax=bioreactor metagenome TaxID=1076179 RepID=A0A645FQ39_9ZZZZ